jgi:adenylate kinase
MTRPPRAAGRCDACAGEVVQRDDDSEATAKKRLMLFDDVTQPLVAYYKAEQVFHQVDAAQDPGQVSTALGSLIDGLAK